MSVEHPHPTFAQAHPHPKIPALRLASRPPSDASTNSQGQPLGEK